MKYIYENTRARANLFRAAAADRAAARVRFAGAILSHMKRYFADAVIVPSSADGP
jgi:hypothetical protein